VYKISRKKFSRFLVLQFLIFFSLAVRVIEDFFSPGWCFLWCMLYIPFPIIGLLAIKKQALPDFLRKILLGFAGAFAVVLPALKLPSVTNTSSFHPAGAGPGAALFGPFHLMACW